MSVAMDLNTKMSNFNNADEVELFIRLLDEGLNVWRPVRAVREGSEYKILPNDHDPDLESWEFVPGKVVVAQKHADGALYAIREFIK